MNLRIWIIAAIAAAYTAAAADQALPVRIGQSFEELLQKAGAQHLLPGGPESREFRHYELSGPLAARLTGKQDGTAYVVFRIDSNNKSSKLVYSSWQYDHEYEQAMLRQFGVNSKRQGRAGNTFCTKLSPTAWFAVADSSTDWSRQAVLEAVTSPNQAQPSYHDLCSPRALGGAR